MQEVQVAAGGTWEAEKKQVLQFTDKLGSPVDKGIVDTVVALRLLGLHTVMSCEGHMNRVTNGPYVLFGSPHHNAYRKQLKELKGNDDEAYRKFRLTVKEENLKEREKLLPFLDRFYKSRYVPYIQRIIIEDVDNKMSYMRCQGADLMLIVSSRDEKKRILNVCQREMETFTDFLKTNLI